MYKLYLYILEKIMELKNRRPKKMKQCNELLLYYFKIPGQWNTKKKPSKIIRSQKAFKPE